MSINPLMQTNLLVLSSPASCSPRVAATDQVRIEALRCPPEVTVQWRVPKAKLGLMWVRDRRGSVRVLSGPPPGNVRAGEANLWFFPEGFDAEGEVVGRTASDCIGLFVEPSFVPLPVKTTLMEPIIGFSDGALGRTFNALAGELGGPDEPQPKYIEGWAMQVLAHLGRSRRVAQSRHPPSGLAPWQLRRAKKMLLADVCEHLPLSVVAAACRLSTSHFSRAFKISTGVPPHQWLIEARLRNAQYLLAQSEPRLADVASMCGFADQSHFSRVFARLHGTTPARWRREHLSNPALLTAPG